MNPNELEITCLVCSDKGTLADIHSKGWRFAKSRVGGYVCGQKCDQVIIDYDDAKKAEQKAKKK